MHCFFRGIIACSLIAGWLSACAPALPDPPAAGPVHLRVGVFNFISFSPLYIALKEGYFAEQGLEVELVNFGSASSEVLPAIAARELDAGGLTLSVAVFNAILEGSNVKYVADKGFIDPDNCSTDAWVGGRPALDSGALSGPETIQGKTVTFPPGGTVEYSLDVLLERAGLTQTDIQAANISDSAARVDGLNTGAVDVSNLSEPWITRAQAAGAGDIWVPFSEVIPNFSLGAIVFGPGILDDRPEAGTRFMIGYLKAVDQFNLGKTDRNIELIAEFTQLAPEDIESSCWTSFRAGGMMDTEGMIAFQQWAFEKGYVDSPLELNQFWTSKFVDEAAAELGH